MAFEAKAMKKVIQKVAADLGTGASQERLFAQKTAFAAHVRTQSGPHRKGWRVIAIFAPGLAVAAAIILLTIQPASPQMDSFTVGERMQKGIPGQWVVTGAAETTRFEFKKGSHIDIQPRSRTRVASVATQQVVVELDSGEIEADIAGNGHTQWMVEAGRWRVMVLGTRFSVKWTESQDILDVKVFRGKVKVSGIDETGTSVLVTRGNRFLATATVQSLLKLEDSGTSPALLTAPPAGAAKDTPAVNAPAQSRIITGESNDNRRSSGHRKNGTQLYPLSGETAPPADAASHRQLDWLVHYANGNYKQALRVATEYGIDTLIEELDATRLWKLQDTARITREHQLSARILHRFRARFYTNPNARIAGFLLGRIALDKKQFSSAAQWFNTYIAEDPAGPLSEEAHGLLIVVYEKMGKSALARRAAREYLARYQGGAFAKIAQGQLN